MKLRLPLSERSAILIPAEKYRSTQYRSTPSSFQFNPDVAERRGFSLSHNAYLEHAVSIKELE
jgi:hypothetical protein